MEMYKAKSGSPITYLSSGITATDTTITVEDITAIPEAPNLLTIQDETNFETIKYETINGNILEGVTRGFDDTTAHEFLEESIISRKFTAYDQNSIIENLNNSSSGGGKKYADIVIGTTTSGHTLDDVDYLCTGENDDVVINEAFRNNKGSVQFLYGTYNINDTLDTGKNITVIDGGGATITSLNTMINYLSIEDINDIHITNTEFSGELSKGYYFIYNDGWSYFTASARISNCDFDLLGNGGCIKISDASNTIICNNIFYSKDNADTILDLPRADVVSWVHIHNNNFYGKANNMISIEGGPSCTITDNYIYSIGTNLNSTGIKLVSDSAEDSERLSLIVSNNDIRSNTGISLTYDKTNLNTNYIKRSYVKITGNTIVNGEGTIVSGQDGYGIAIQGTGVYTTIDSNTIFTKGSIKVDSTVNLATMISNNLLSTSIVNESTSNTTLSNNVVG